MIIPPPRGCEEYVWWRWQQSLTMSLTCKIQSLIYNSQCLVMYSRNECVPSPQVGANFLLVSAATLLGLMSYFFADKKHRRAFLETRQSLEVKMVIEEQSREQVSHHKWSPGSISVFCVYYSPGYSDPPRILICWRCNVVFCSPPLILFLVHSILHDCFLIFMIFLYVLCLCMCSHFMMFSTCSVVVLVLYTVSSTRRNSNGTGFRREVIIQEVLWTL